MSRAEDGARADVLRRLAILDTEPEPAFDALVRLATSAFGVGSAMITFAEDARLWFKAREGFAASEADHRVSFCRHAMAEPRDVMVVPDARADPRFRTSPHVTGDPFIRFYAGAPLVVDGATVGTLCLTDPAPRETFGAEPRAALRALAATVEELLRLRLESAARRAKADALDVASRKMALAEELSGVGHWSLDIDSGRVTWSAQVYRIHGLDPETFDPQLQQALDFYEPRSRARVQARVQAAIETGHGFAVKAQLVRASDGAVRTVVSRGELTVSGEGGGAALVGVFQDVTAQEKLLQQVKADRERYRLLTQNSTDVIATYDLQGVFSYVSPAIERMIGVRPERLVGRRTYEIIHPDDHARIAGEFADFLRSGAESTRIEYRVLPAEGAPFWVEAHPSPMRDAKGRVVGFQDVVRDVSARRAAEEAASESERRYRLLAENANDMIALTSTEDSTIFFVSPGSRRVLGYEPRELVGRPTLELTHPDDRKAVLRHFAALLTAGPTETVTPYQFRGLHKDGTWVWLEGQPRVQYDDAGVAVAFQDVVRDISQRKRLEDHLQAARDAAESATRAKSDFLANMSHELRTPLSGILGYADVLTDAPELTASSRRHADLIGRSGRTLLALVNDVLDLSKIEAGGLDLSPRPTDLGAWLDGAVDAVRPQAQAKGLALIVDAPPSPPQVLVDADRLHQVLLNLLGNAIKFTDAGEVRVALTAAPSGPARLALELSVADTGIGLDADQLARIFGRFEQADASITRRFGGTGLGLSISQAIVERMGGSLKARGEVGRGSVFTVSLDLPEAAAEVAPELPARRGARAALDGLKVLVAEDVAINHELISLFLSKHGVVVTRAGNGEEAVAAAARQAFDAVLMDVQMPVLDGVEATRRIRASGGPNARVPIVALTANVLPAQIADCRAAGMTGHVEKPFTADTLSAALEAAVTFAGAPDPLPHPAEPGAASSRREPLMTARICICDDDPVTGALLSLDLRAAGFDVEEPLTSVAAAIGYLSASAPDLLLLDLNMPGGGGLELLGYLRAQGLVPSTRIVMLTSEGDVFYMNQARRLGAVGYLVKPVDSGHLVSRVSRALDDPNAHWIDDLSVLTTGDARLADPGREAATPRRRRILSVEDVACNQQLVALFLDDETCTVDAVETGEDALSAVSAKRYDLMLLDLRLPDIDGLAVIRRIRRAEGDGRRLPVVVVSADVLPAQVNAALAAGADDHLAKPFSASALRDVVARHLGAAGDPLDELNPTVAKLVRDYGREAVTGLLRSLASQLATLRTTPPQPGPLEQAAHAIKGAAAGLGFAAVSAACDDLKRACRLNGACDRPLARAVGLCEDVRLRITELLARSA